MIVNIGELNYLAVIVAVIVNMAAGALWYSPMLFAKTWASENGFNLDELSEQRSGAYIGYAVSIVASIVIVLVMAVLAQATRAEGWVDGLALGLMAGIGFTAMSMGSNYTFEDRGIKLYLINAGYPLLSYTGIGLLVTLWQ